MKKDIVLGATSVASLGLEVMDRSVFVSSSRRVVANDGGPRCLLSIPEIPTCFERSSPCTPLARGPVSLTEATATDRKYSERGRRIT